MTYNKYKKYIVETINNVVKTTSVMAKKVTKTKKSKNKQTSSTTSTEVTFDVPSGDTGLDGMVVNSTLSINIDDSSIKIDDKPPKDDKPHGHFEGTYWVWPNGQKTHVRFIDIAIRKMKPLPRGFYEEAEKETYLTNMKNMLRKAKQLKLPDSIDIRNEE